MLSEKIDDDLKIAMKCKEAEKVQTLRMVKSAAKNVAIEKKKDTLEDAELVKVINKMVKQRKDSIEEFKKGNRQDLVEKEENEIKILLGYLPEAISAEELERVVVAVISECGAIKKADMGKVMKLVLEKTAGRVDGKVVSQKVASKLG